MIKNKGFETIIADDADHERIFCEIYYDGLFVALISQERSEAVFDLETPPSGLEESRVIRKVDLKGFREAVDTACRRLRGQEQ